MKLEHFVGNVNKALKKNIIARGNEILVVPRFDTGSDSLNFELGGGAPEGRIITLTAEEGAGKTAMTLKMLAGLLDKHPKHQFVWVDAEGAWDDQWAKALGVDVDRVYVVRPEYAEQGYQIAVEALSADDVCGVAIDSAAAMIPKAELEGEMEDVTVAAQARLNKRFLRKAQKFLLETDREVVPTIFMITQWTTNIGGYGNPDIEGGGKALRYYPSVKLTLKRGELFDGKKLYKNINQNDEGVEVCAQAIKFYVEKNKTAPPKRRGHFWFYFDHLDDLRRKGSVDRLEEVIRYARKYGIVVQRGSIYDLPNPSTGELMSFKGSAMLADYIRENEAIQTWIRAEVLKRVNELHEEEEVSADGEEPQGSASNEDDVLDSGWEVVTDDSSEGV